MAALAAVPIGTPNWARELANHLVGTRESSDKTTLLGDPSPVIGCVLFAACDRQTGPGADLKAAGPVVTPEAVKELFRDRDINKVTARGRLRILVKERPDTPEKRLQIVGDLL